MIRGKRYMLNTPREPERFFDTAAALAAYVNSTVPGVRVGLEDDVERLAIGAHTSLGDGRTVFAIPVVVDDEFAVMSEKLSFSDPIETADKLIETVVPAGPDPIANEEVAPTARPRRRATTPNG